MRTALLHCLRLVCDSSTSNPDRSARFCGVGGGGGEGGGGGAEVRKEDWKHEWRVTNQRLL